MLQELGHHGLLHWPLRELGAQPVLVVGQPLVGERLVELLLVDQLRLGWLEEKVGQAKTMRSDDRFRS